MGGSLPDAVAIPIADLLTHEDPNPVRDWTHNSVLSHHVHSS